MKENINLNLLKYFYEVVNTKNITKASKNLFVSQPAITSAIKELEEEFKVKLLNRSKKGVTPTLEGEILYNNIKEIFNNLNTTINTRAADTLASTPFCINDHLLRPMMQSVRNRQSTIIDR